jgi:SUN domain-containing protein 1/2
VAPSRLGSVAITTATPAQGSTRRKGALPKVKPRDSQAYGSGGRVNAAQQLTVTATGFAQAFGTQRDEAITRDVEEESDERDLLDELAAGVTTQLLTSTPKEPTNVGENGHPPSASTSHLDTSITSKSFGITREGGMNFARPALRDAMSGFHSFQRPTNRAGPQRPLAPLWQPPWNNSFVSDTNSDSVQAPKATQDSAPVSNVQNGSPAAGVNPASNSNQAPGHPQTAEHHGRVEPGSPVKRFLKLLLGDASDNVSIAGLVAVFKGLFFVFLGFIIGMILYSFMASGMPGAILSRATYSWNGIKNLVQPPVVSTPPAVQFPKWYDSRSHDRMVDQEGREVDEPGYDPIFGRVLRMEWRTKDMEEKLDKKLAESEQKVAEFAKGIGEIKRHLPPAVIVIRHPDDSLEIPDEFWRALVSKMRSEGLAGPSNSADTNWNEFLVKNRQKILRFMSDELKNSELGDRFRTISQKEFASLMQKEYVKLSALIEKKVADSIKNSPKMKNDLFINDLRIESLALVNLVANSELNNRKVNYFSTGLGARIDPWKTSSTFVPPVTGSINFVQSLYTSVFRNMFYSRTRRPPITALEKWDEPGECWCAAPDDNAIGLAQLAILLGHPMSPRQVTVEHLPKDASLDITSAPKEIELWAESDEKRATAPNCGKGPKGWICLGKISYNVHADNHIQTFNLDSTVTKPIRNTMVRIMSNWGADHTCVYRVRLHGETVKSE